MYKSGTKIALYYRMKTSLLTILILLTMNCTSKSATAYCFEEAAEKYDVSPLLLWSIAKVESNFDPNAIHHNKNGLGYDYGLMQINSRTWFKTLGSSGWEKLSDPCFCTKMGAFVLSDCFKVFGKSWEGVGCYNAGAKINKEYKRKRLKYAKRVRKIYLNYIKQ